MPRFPYPDREGLSELQAKARDGYLNIGKMTAYFPDSFLRTFSAFGNTVLTDTTLDPHLRELAIIRVGYLCNSPYEIHQHEHLARNIGMAEDKVVAVKDGPESPAFNEREKRVLRFVEELVIKVRPSDEALAEVRKELSIPEIFCLIAATGTYMMICRILETTGVEMDPDGVIVDPGKP